MVEVIGFFISFLALIFLFLKNQFEEKKKQKKQPLIKPNLPERKSYQSPVKVIEKEVRKRELHDQQPPKSKKNSSKPLQKKMDISTLEERHLKSSIEHRELQNRLKTHQLKSNLDKHHLMTSIDKYYRDKDEQEFPIQQKSRAAQILKGLPHLKNMIVCHEILDKPKGLK